MRKLLIVAALATGVGVSAPVYADRVFEQCVEAATGSGAVARNCANAFIAREEGHLAASWRRALAIVGGAKTQQGASLLNEQRAWIAFKDKACLHYYTPGLSSLEAQNGRLCKARLISDRTAELENIIADFPGDD
jgi:uncharacterized protein YecT (DUF1311 family)